MASKYWTERGKTDTDKLPGKTWTASDGTLRCNECCNKDFDEDEECNHTYYRPQCPHCLGTGVNATVKVEELVLRKGRAGSSPVIRTNV